MTWDLNLFRLVTASAYLGMMAPLTQHPSCVCVLAGDSDATTSDTTTRDSDATTGDRSFTLLSLEGLDGVRRRWRFGDVSRLADFVPKVLAESPSDDRPILLVPPRASHSWQSAADAWPGRVRLATSPMCVVDRIADDKIYVRAELRRLGVPVPDQLVVERSEMDFRSIRAALDAPFVLQSPTGAGGQGTHLIGGAAELRTALVRSPSVRRWLVSRFAGDVTINVAGVVHHDGVELLPASVQTSGITELGVDFGAYCGSDYACGDVSTRALAAAYHHTATIGEWLRGLGHLGLFGADIAVDEDRIAFLEINPRIQGSSWLLSALQARDGIRPCLLQHVHAVLGQPLVTRASRSVRSGSHLMLRWRGPAGVLRAVPAAGHIEHGVRLSALPQVGTTIHPGAILGRLESSTSLAAPSGRQLRPTTSALVEALFASVETSPIPS